MILFESQSNSLALGEAAWSPQPSLGSSLRTRLSVTVQRGTAASMVTQCSRPVGK